MFDLDEKPHRVLASWIWQQLQTLEITSIFLPFGGPAQVGSLLKRQGKQILTSDLLQSYHWWNKGLVENNGHTLSLVMQGRFNEPHPNEGNASPFVAWANQYFTEEEVGWLNRWFFQMSDPSVTDEDRALGHAAVYWTMSYWLGFNRRHLQEKPMTPHVALLHYMQQGNAWVYDNQMPNASYWTDPYGWMPSVQADALLVVPPDQEGWTRLDLKSYLWECWTRGVSQLDLTQVVPAEGYPKLGENLGSQYTQAVDDFLTRAAHIPYWAVAAPDETAAIWREVMARHRPLARDEIKVLAYPGAAGTQTVEETLLVAQSS